MVSAPIRTLHVETYTHLAGGQRGLLDLVTHLDRSLVEPTVVIQGPGRLEEGLIKAGVRVIRKRLEPFRNRWLPWSWRFGVGACCRLIKTLRPHVVHSNHLYVGRYSGRAARTMGVPSLVTLRLVHEPETWDRWNRWETLRAHDRIVSNSLEGARVHAHNSEVASKLSTIWNGIDLRRFCPVEDWTVPFLTETLFR